MRLFTNLLSTVGLAFIVLAGFMIYTALGFLLLGAALITVAAALERGIDD